MWSGKKRPREESSLGRDKKGKKQYKCKTNDCDAWQRIDHIAPYNDSDYCNKCFKGPNQQNVSFNKLFECKTCKKMVPLFGFLYKNPTHECKCCHTHAKIQEIDQIE